MLRSSIPFGRVLGVDLRLHITFPLLLAFSVIFSETAGNGVARGVVLWFAICFAVLVREVARAVAATYIGIQLHALFLLPIGGIMAFTGVNAEADTSANRRLLMLSGPLANLAVGLMLLGTAYALEPQVSLLAQPWIDPSHLLRSVVWLQMMLGALSLLPMPAVASNRNAGREANGTATENRPKGRPFAITVPRLSLGVVLALAMVLIGLVLMNLWLVILGGFVMLAVIVSRPPALSGSDAETILVREVMLTEYTLLSSSDTLKGALDRTVHSLQDVFPVVRGDQLVGSVARQTIASRLIAEGDSYLQGIMTRSLQLASPTEKLVEALRRTSALGANEFIPVVECGAMIGILTPQSLSRAVHQVKMTRPSPELKREKPRD